MSVAVVDPERARDEARHILEGRKYKGAPVPRPLRGVLRWIGDRLAPITRWIGDRLSWIPSPARPWVAVTAAILAVIAIGLAVRHFVLARAKARAARIGSGGRDVHSPALGDDPAALEAAALEAESRGDLALAVRLRFRAGLLRLDGDAHAISYRSSIPTAEVREELASTAFDDLADTFEDIAYGGSEAEPTDTADAKREWPRVVQAARRR